MKLYFILLFILVVILVSFSLFFSENFSGMELLKEKFTHPYRKFCNERGEIVPIITMTAFSRSKEDIDKYWNFINNGIKVIGFTSYKSFPKPISDKSGDFNTTDDTFNYLAEIKNWVVCFKNPQEYGFTSENNIIEMSESDFIDAKDYEPVEKKYDFIYSCLADDDKACPLDGWNAINRNFDLAIKCFPIMVKDFNLKILVVGRTNCGLEELYPNNIEVVSFLPYHDFQTKLKESRYLFVPNIYDASPRVVTEAISNDIPVLMNRSIICGSKYINDETGELFTDNNDIYYHLKRLLSRKMSPRAWWRKNYSRKESGVKLRNFLLNAYPDIEILQNSKEIYFG